MASLRRLNICNDLIKSINNSNILRSNCFCSLSSKYQNSPDTLKQNKATQTSQNLRYQPYEENNTEVILDIYEEKNKHISQINELKQTNPYEGLNTKRGLNGVFEIEDLVDVLRKENGEDIFVAKIPKNIKYADYICVVSGRSTRHLQALGQFVRHMYKVKRDLDDQIPKLEGSNSKDWMALDLGNIALHIFSKEARTLYDLDSLWALGPKFDKECNKQDPVVIMMEKHSIVQK